MIKVLAWNRSNSRPVVKDPIRTEIVWIRKGEGFVAARQHGTVVIPMTTIDNTFRSGTLRHTED